MRVARGARVTRTGYRSWLRPSGWEETAGSISVDGTGRPRNRLNFSTWWVVECASGAAEDQITPVYRGQWLLENVEKPGIRVEKRPTGAGVGDKKSRDPRG